MRTRLSDLSEAPPVVRYGPFGYLMKVESHIDNFPDLFPLLLFFISFLTLGDLQDAEGLINVPPKHLKQP